MPWAATSRNHRTLGRETPGVLPRSVGRRRHETRLGFAVVGLVASAASLWMATPSSATATAPKVVAHVVTSAPAVDSISPSSVTAGGGTLVRITGSGFNAVQAVSFGPNASSTVTVVSDSEITAVAPVGAGTVLVQVVTGSGTSAAGPAAQLTYVPTGQPPITTSGTHLEIDGQPTTFTGVNAYELATDWGVNAGCGGMYTTAQISAMFAGLKRNSLVRFDVFEGTLGTNATTHAIDWAPIDHIFSLAAQYRVYLIPVITSQFGGCDGGHWQDPAWYEGGYRQAYTGVNDSDGTGDDPLPYWNYLQLLVNRYHDSPALGMWEPIGEPEASTCPTAFEPSDCSGHQTCTDESTAAAALRSFFDVVGGEIHQLDPEHLVEAGFLGGGQCGTQYSDYAMVGASPGIDVLSVHDYYGTAPLGGDQWNGMAFRMQQAAALGKPIITGESGLLAGVNQPGCVSLAQRASDDTAKMQAQFAAGSSAFIVWNWSLDPLGPCSYNTGPGDPLMNSFN